MPDRRLTPDEQLQLEQDLLTHWGKRGGRQALMEKWRMSGRELKGQVERLLGWSGYALTWNACHALVEALAEETFETLAEARGAKDYKAAIGLIAEGRKLAEMLRPSEGAMPPGAQLINVQVGAPQVGSGRVGGVGLHPSLPASARTVEVGLIGGPPAQSLTGTPAERLAKAAEDGDEAGA